MDSSSPPGRTWPDRIATALSLQAVFYRETEVISNAGPRVIVSPCRSKVARIARIGSDGRIPEKKRFGRQAYFSLGEVVKREETARVFAGGDYINLYLSPWDYHFLIFPTAGRVTTAFALDGFNLPVVAWGVRCCATPNSSP